MKLNYQQHCAKLREALDTKTPTRYEVYDAGVWCVGEVFVDFKGDFASLVINNIRIDLVCIDALDGLNKAKVYGDFFDRANTVLSYLGKLEMGWTYEN